MILQNKKTGVLGVLEATTYHGGRPDNIVEVYEMGMGAVRVLAQYKTLGELLEEWEDAPKEEWRDVLGFEELYQVSNLGNVRTVKRGEAIEMAQEEHWNGYLSVHLRNKGVERRASVHRLVAEAFIPNPDGLRDVNHKNGIKTDNRVENLEWLSHSDNMKHMYQMNESAEPLIKDEKIRKAVRAWVEINSIEKACVNVSSNGARGIEPSWFSIIGLDENGCSWEIEIHADYFERVSKYYKGDMVGIAELCGEDAPEPTEPTFVDLDERIKEKEKKPRPVIANGVEYDSYADYLKSREEKE